MRVLILALSAVFFSFAAHADENPDVGTVQSVSAECKEGMSVMQAGLADSTMGLCIGFIDAVMQDLGERRAAGEKIPACLPAVLTEGQVVNIFVKWADQHPERRPAIDGIRAALNESFPCGK
jgi:hypothetical protein